MNSQTFPVPRRAHLTALAAGIVAVAVVAAGSLVVTPALAAPVAPPIAPSVTGGGGLHPVAVTFAPNGATAYVVDQGGFINVVNTATDSVTTQINTSDSFYTSGQLSGGAVSPDGTALFVAVYNNLGGPSVLRYSTSTNLLVNQRALGGGSPGAVAVTPDGSSVLVVGQMTGGQRALFDLSVSTGVSTPIELGATVSNNTTATAIAVSADSATAYVTTDRAAVTKVDLAARKYSDVPVAAAPRGLALTADGSTLYVAGSTGVVQTIATATDTVSTLATVAGGQLNSIAISPDSTRIVAVGSSSTTSGQAWIYSANPADAPTAFTTGSNPWAVAVSPTGTKAYATNESSGTTSVVPLRNFAPTLTADTAAGTATVGVAYTAQFAASGYPTPTFSSTGTLPAGLTLNATTGLLSGKPTTPGASSFTVVASNGEAPDAAGITHTITVKGVLKAYTPTVSGTKKVGKTLKAKTTAWTPANVTLKYQWYRYSKAKWVKISKATSTSHKLVKADKGHKVRVVVTGSKSGYVTATKTSKSSTIK